MLLFQCNSSGPTYVSQSQYTAMLLPKKEAVFNPLKQVFYPLPYMPANVTNTTLLITKYTYRHNLAC